MTFEEIAKIRKYFKLNYEQFGALLGVTGAAVAAWEKVSNSAVKLMRLYKSNPTLVFLDGWL